MLKTIKILRSNNLILYTRLERLHDKSYISHLSLSTWPKHHIWRQENFHSRHIHYHPHRNSYTWNEEEVNCQGALCLRGELLQIMLRRYWEIGVIVNRIMKALILDSFRGEVKFHKMWIHTLQQSFRNQWAKTIHFTAQIHNSQNPSRHIIKIRNRQLMCRILIWLRILRVQLYLPRYSSAWQSLIVSSSNTAITPIRQLQSEKLSLPKLQQSVSRDKRIGKYNKHKEIVREGEMALLVKSCPRIHLLKVMFSIKRTCTIEIEELKETGNRTKTTLRNEPGYINGNTNYSIISNYVSRGFGVLGFWGFGENIVTYI